MATFGERFKQLRKEYKMTQEELANKFFTTKSSISRYEKNENIPEIDSLKKYADFFNVSIDYLLGRSDFRTPADRITEALQSDIELLEFWEETKDRENVQLLFKQIRNLSDKDINQVIRIIKAIEDEEEKEGN